MTDTTSSRARSIPRIGELITSQQLADQLGVPVATVYQWRMHGTGPKAIRVGRHTRYRVTDVCAWLDENTQS